MLAVQTRALLPELKAMDATTSWERDQRVLPAGEERTPHIGPLENIRGSQYLISLSDQIEPDAPWLACTHARRCRPGAASGWTALLFLFLENLVLSQDKSAFEQALEQLQSYNGVIGTSLYGLDFHFAMAVQSTLPQQLDALRLCHDQVTIMCQLEEMVNNDVKHDAMVAYIKVIKEIAELTMDLPGQVLSVLWQTSHSSQMTPYPSQNAAVANILNSPNIGPDEVSIAAVHDLLLRPLGFELDFVHPKKDMAEVKLMFRFCNSRLAAPVMALVCAENYFCLLSVRPELSMDDNFSWPSLLPQPVRPGSVAPFGATSSGSYATQWPEDLTSNSWSGTSVMQGMSLDQTARVRADWTPEQSDSGKTPEVQQPMLGYMQGQMRPAMLSSNASLDMSGMLSQVQSMMPVGPSYGVLQPRDQLQMQAIHRGGAGRSSAVSPQIKMDPIRFSVHNTWIPGEPADKQTLMPLRVGTAAQPAASVRRTTATQPTKYSTIHFKAVDPSERQSRSKTKRPAQKKRDDTNRS